MNNHFIQAEPSEQQPASCAVVAEKKTVVFVEPIVAETAPSSADTATAEPVAVRASVHQEARTHQRWSLAETVEEVQENDDDDAWDDDVQDTHPAYVQSNAHSETLLTSTEEGSTSLVAVALYDYQASADDELSFDPDDIITNIEMVMNILLTCRD